MRSRNNANKGENANIKCEIKRIKAKNRESQMRNNANRGKKKTAKNQMQNGK